MPSKLHKKNNASQTRALANSFEHRKLRQALLRWYDKHKRVLPWRGIHDPYAIWVSEVMLQQTQVQTVIPYYERFMKRFPTLHHLAEASEEDLLCHWSGLGYYRRARYLHQGVREVQQRYGGQFPQDAEARLRLPGIGRYTAGAIGSIAFDQAEAVVDGNVARVLSRVAGMEAPLGSKESDNALWALADILVRGKRPGDFNQSVMELGALVCTPKNPRCEICPLKRYCHAFQQGRVSELPIPKKRKAPSEEHWVSVLALGKGGASTNEQAFWLSKEQKSRFGGLWMLPSQLGKGAKGARHVLAAAELSGRLQKQPLTCLQHVLSHRKMTVELWVAHETTATGHTNNKLVLPSELQTLGISSLTRKLVAAAEGALV